MYSLNFSFFFLSFTTVFVFAQCDGNFTEVSEADGTCKSNQIVGKVWKSIACKPRDTLVELNPKPGQMFSPPVVSVSRCGGHTSKDLICAPTNATSIQIKRIPVKVTTSSINGLKTECRVVNVDEHIQCIPTYMIKETDCKIGQSYKQTLCKCECTDQVQKNACKKLTKKTWNEENCQCVCQKKEECPNGYTWNVDVCKCL